MKRAWFLVSIVLLLSFLSLGAVANSEIVVNPVKNQITISEQALFHLTITNREDVVQRYTIYSLQSGQGWSVDPTPLKDKIVEIPAGKSRMLTIGVAPLDAFLPGIYHVQVTIESDRGERYNEQLKMYIGPEQPQDYLPSLKVTVDMDEEIDPREPQAIKLFLENRNPLDLSQLVIRIQSDIPEFEKEVNVAILPLGKKTVEFAVIPNKYQQPKEYTLFFVLEHKGQTIKVVEQKMAVKEIIPPFTTLVVWDDIYLDRFLEMSISNEGNVPNTQEVKIPLTRLGSLLMASEGIVKNIGGQQFLTWKISLSPGKSQIVRGVVRYRLLAYGGAFLLLLLLFYWLVRSPLAMGKSATATQPDPETLSNIKVTIEVRNRSSKPIKDILISDVIPGIASLEQTLELGTMKHHEVKHTKRGTKVIWKLPEIEAHEHRLITYKVQAKLNILGKIRLPRASVEFKKHGLKRKAYSNAFWLGA